MKLNAIQNHRHLAHFLLENVPHTRDGNSAALRGRALLLVHRATQRDN